MSINLAEKVSPVVDERFKRDSVTENIGFNKNYNWNGVATLSVYDVDTVELTDYTRSGSARYGEVADLGDTKTDYTVEQDKAFTYAIDEGDSKSQEDVKKREGASLSREINEVVIPAIDMHRLAVMEAGARTVNQVVDGSSITKANAYEKFLGMNEFLDEHNVPVTGRITYVVPSYYNKLKQDESFVKSSDIGQKMLLNGQVGQVDGNKIIKVPTAYLPEGCVAITVYPKALVSPKKITQYNRHSNPPGINGILVEGRLLFDAFILNAKKYGVAILGTPNPSPLS